MAVQSKGWAEPEHRSVRMLMVQYLVGDLGLDVNDLDTEEVPTTWARHYVMRPMFPGDSEEVTRFLLSRMTILPSRAVGDP